MTLIRLEELENESFAPFGRIVTPPATTPDATGNGWSWWAEIAPLTGDGTEWGIGYLDLEVVDRRIDWAERHMRTEEAVLATWGDLIVYVAPAEHLDDPAHPPTPSSFRAFRVRAGSGVVLGRGVWHGAPFAAEVRTSALILILDGTGRDDVTVVSFPDTPIEIDAGVSLPSADATRNDAPRPGEGARRKE